MNTYRRIARAGLFVVALFALTTPVWAQTALSSTTLSAAVADSQTRTLTVTSATGITAPGSGATQVVLLIDREIMTVTAVNGTTISVSRGPDTRVTPHINGAIVWIAPRNAVYSLVPSGQCTRTTLPYVPYIVGAGPGLGQEVGTLYDCLGVTTAGQWTPTNTSSIPIFGSTVVSANTIAPTGTYFKTSGTTVIKTITVPAGTAPGFSITIEATGIDTWDATGNILTAGTFTAAGHTVTFYWNGAKWVPDKVS
jgi:hypothetical protein